jgi:hypothetical protein
MLQAHSGFNVVDSILIHFYYVAAMKTFQKPLIFKTLAVLLSLAISIGIVELALVYVDEIRAKKKVIKAELFQNQTEIDLHSLNYNDTVVSKNKPPGSIRILSFGDSYAFSIVKYPYSYHGRAQKELNEGGSTPVRIVNLGEPAVSIYQYIKAYQFWGEVLEHDAVIVNLFLGNDLQDIAIRGGGADRPINDLFLNMDFNINTGIPPRVRIPKRYLLRSVDYLMAFHYYLTKKIVPVSTLPGPEFNWATLKIEEKSFLKMHLEQTDNFNFSKISDLKEGYIAVVRLARVLAQVRQHGKKVVVLLSPSQFQIEKELREKVAKAHTLNLKSLDLDLSAYLINSIFSKIDSQIPVLYLAESLDCAYQKNESLYYDTDTHWSPAGNQVVGIQLATTLHHFLFSKKIKGSVECGRGDPLPRRRFIDTPQRIRAFDQHIKPLI